jgi:hypothetical protein
MIRRPRVASVLGILCAASVLALAACGGPADPSAQGVTLRGALEGGQASLASGNAPGQVLPIVVTVEEDPAITTTVGPDGTFSLRGLPEGSFTLVFTRDGRVLATMVFDAVKPNQEITIRVGLSANGLSIVLLEEKRDGIGHGDLEIEGLVQEVLSLNPAGDSLFLIDGQRVIARAGQTSIREGNQRRTVNDVTLGRRVHVKGVWLESTTGLGQVVLALEIKLQGGAEDGNGDGSKACMISGGKVGKKIELEGTIATASTVHFFQLLVNGNRSTGPVDVDATGASIKCNGPKTSPAQCQAQVTAGAKVHVSGLLDACDSSRATVTASEVKVQK